MPRYKSIDGKWYPVNEHHINANAEPGENPVYEGPDRAATEILKAEGKDHLGQDYRMNPDLRKKARELGYTGKEAIDNYLQEMHGVDPAENTKKCKKDLAEKVHTGKKVVNRKKPVNPSSGGDDTSGSGKSRKGGFGDPEDIREGLSSRV